VLNYARQIAEALEHAHERGIMPKPWGLGIVGVSGNT
jgi:hypothetical protein